MSSNSHLLPVTSSSNSSLCARYKELMCLAFDSELAKASGIPVEKMEYLLSILSGLAIVASIRTVGVLLVSSLLVIPAIAGIQLSNSFRRALVLSVIFAISFTLAGIFISFYADIAPGGTIVMTSIIVTCLATAGKRIIRTPIRRQT